MSISLSHFLPRQGGISLPLKVGLLNFCSCPQDKFVMVVAPGYAHLPAIKIHYTLTVFWLRSTLYRDTALVPAANSVTRDNFAAPIKLVPLHCTRWLRSNFYTMTNLWPPKFCTAIAPILTKNIHKLQKRIMTIFSADSQI